MNESPIIVPVTLKDTGVKKDSRSQVNQQRPVCHLKINQAEVTFYNGVNKHILHAVLAEMSKYVR